ncbi:hypothetical protein [Streptomyces sp. NPDC001307]|uniref:hypothetical protein n=1 Tax=Streptomyces sp. NPDC001307 TaxID=3364560 RepID=UPI0036A3AE46
MDVALERPPGPADHGGREVKSTGTDYTRRTLPETSQSKLGTDFHVITRTGMMRT